MPTDTYRSFAELVASEPSSSYHIGGRDAQLAERLTGALAAAGFSAGLDNTADHPGRLAANICNRGRSGCGCQLELSHGLRHTLFAGLKRKQREHRTERFHKFVAAVRAILLKKDA